MARQPLELQSLKWPFVGLAVLLALTSAWAVYDEVFSRRPWKDYQREFYKLQEQHLREDLARAEKRLQDPETQARLKAARDEHEAAEKAISGDPKQRQAYEQAVKADQDAKDKAEERKLYLGFDKSEWDAEYYVLRDARHHGDKDAEAKSAKRLADWEAKIAEKERLYKEAVAHHKQTTAAKLAFVQRRDEARAKVEAIEKPLADIRVKLEPFEGPLGKLPDMEQYWINDLPNSWGGPTVDRCQNCHVGVNRGGFSAPWEVLEARRKGLPEPELRLQYGLDAEVIDQYQATFDKLCEALPEVTRAVPVGGMAAVEPPAPPDPASATECRPVDQYRKWLDQAAAYCGRTARWLPQTKVVLKDSAGAVFVPQKDEKLRAVLKEGDHGAAHADDDALAGVAQACADKDTVATFEEAAKADPYDVKPVFRTHPYRMELLVKNHQPESIGCTTCHGGEGAQTKGVMHKKFRHGADDKYWNDPLTEEVTVLGKKFKGAFMQAKCDKCHAGTLELAHAPTLSQGKKLFTDVGCWGCHPVEGYNELAKRGPTLTNISSKTSPGWLVKWIEYPKGWRPGTRMPNFWPGAVDASFVPDAGTPEEVVAKHTKIRGDEVAAITAYIWTTSDTEQLAQPKPGDAERGKDLFDNVGCRGCHVADKDSVARRSDSSRERDYAPNLWNIADKAKPDWIYAWIKNPKAMWKDTKMPDLRLTDAEASDVLAYLLTLKSDQTYQDPPEYAPGGDKQALSQLSAKGRDLIAKYGCFGCHDIKGFENAQKIGTELTDHGRKAVDLLDFGDVKWFAANPKYRQTYPNWVWTKLHTPRIYGYERAETRMPQFDFTEEEALAVLTFLKGQTGEKVPARFKAAQDPRKKAIEAGEKFVYWNGCRNCHVVEGVGGTVRDLYDEDTQSFAPPLLSFQGWKTQPSWLYGFLKEPMELRPWLRIRMPTFHFTDAEATTAVHYFSAHSNKSFPYLTTEAPKMTPARAKEAMALFAELKCQSCHVLGKLGPNQDPASAAPNLLLAKERLRPDWMVEWLKNPQALMEGTRMPGFWDFSDPAAPTSPSKAFGGDAQQQIEALRDLLMLLGNPGFEVSRKTADSGAPSGTRG